MNEPESVFDYRIEVYNVLMQPNVLMGIGLIPAMAILIFTIVLMNLISIWCVCIGIILFVVAKQICKSDFYMLQFLFERLNQPTMWRCS